ncbi:MAG TPA: glutamine--fructose-6-phosphate transaminase (isomerizing) [Candidatus Lachnoclostridium pullistercoris]|uniref:Glutamine--fructose-6-phosphate aminotransferase [isomerizing] n=1 Tax=Candidatus Lachnoclostridium pullistercoris TaxID=2838632 RepID=A0A9D2PDP8_9FIRM|nr:glutamine--fructose-6-phosphate transaminase (isomerizing) [Candidatus Lachnoclostridium pullistercoris]
MCGIIGYTGPLQAKDVLLNGLSQLEYRGYDSAGIAFFESGQNVRVVKTTGKVARLKELCSSITEEIHCGIGHTRWATHGGVTVENAHPHQAGRVTLIHNGIIENYHQLTADFHLEGTLISQTDSEVAARVLDQIYDHDPISSIRRLVPLLEGSYGFCILFSDHPGEIYAVRNVSPLVAAYTHSGSLIASDLTALIPYTRKYAVVPENQIVKLTPYRMEFYQMDGTPASPEILEVNWDTDAAMKNGYPHFMLKEIHEQPEALKKTILPRLTKGLPDFGDDGIPDSLFQTCSQIRIVACGTAMHAGMVARAVMEPLLKIPVLVSVASEFRYEDPLVNDQTLTIVISQSGETIDTLAALRLAKELGSKVLSVVNVKGSTIARESDYVLYTHAGPEIAVASTKAYSVQLAALYMITCRMACVRGKMTDQEAASFMEDLLDVIPAMEEMLDQAETIKTIVRPLIDKPDAFFIGRNLDYAFSLEGALKLKEISYIHADAYAAGELKHGTIALIADQVPVIALATQDRIFSKMISNVREVKARGAYVILITKKEADVDPELADVRIRIPDLHDRFTVFPIAVVLQLIAYYASLLKGLDVDQPRNLAKSVTVE